MQLVSLATLGVLLVTMSEPTRRVADLGWAALGGVAASIALVAFYRALAIGPMSSAAALTALVGTVVPVAVGLALGERPGSVTLLGVAACIPAAVLVSAGGSDPTPDPVADASDPSTSPSRDIRRTRRLSVVAGLGFGLFFVCLSRVGDDAGLFPLLGARVASIALLAAVLTVRRSWTAMDPASWWPVVAAGVLDCAANATYLLAIARGDLTWVAAISSLYPVATVVLARLVLHERLSRWQVAGLVLAVGALAAVAAGS